MGGAKLKYFITFTRKNTINDFPQFLKAIKNLQFTILLFNCQTNRDVRLLRY